MDLHRNFSSARLVRLLGAWAAVDGDTPRQDVAERLGPWLGVSEAITLHATHQALQAGAPRADAPTARTPAVDAAVQQVRAALAQAIVDDARPPPPGDLAALDDRYAPFQQRHLAQQRQMEARIGPLRAQLRQAVSRASPRLQPLATLDAAMEHALAERTQKLLSTVPQWLERHFGQLREAHRQQLAASGQPDDPALWWQPGGWLAVFSQAWRDVLLAELEVRLEPVTGLMEAWRNEVRTSQ